MGEIKAVTTIGVPEKSTDFRWFMPNPSSVPLQSQVKLSKADYSKGKEEIEKIQPIRHASACGTLIYAMVSTRLNIAFAVGVISRCEPTRTKSLGCSQNHCDSEGDFNLHGYCDSDMAVVIFPIKTGFLRNSTSFTPSNLVRTDRKTDR